MRVCALLLPRTATPRVCLLAVSTIRATLTERYPVLALPTSDIELMEQILDGLRQTQNLQAINKEYTPEGGSLTEEN
jgi:hypothetical protein